ncbi:hypothetical protein BGX26_007416 [Mortierella sp. AD094]|nr:hypothetical protein BGX26_007416 [Mortierella sp. AD094]
MRQQVPSLLRAIPQLLHFVASTHLIVHSEEIVATLLQCHGAHLRSFLIQDEVQVLPQNNDQQQYDSFFASENNFYQHPLYQQVEGLFPIPQDPQQTRVRRLCLQVLETCPNLQVSDCKIPIPLQDVIASIPSWSCRHNLSVLRLELSELTELGVIAVEEEEVMEMFIKSLFLGALATPSGSPSSFQQGSTPVFKSTSTPSSTLSSAPSLTPRSLSPSHSSEISTYSASSSYSLPSSYSSSASMASKTFANSLSPQSSFTSTSPTENSRQFSVPPVSQDQAYYSCFDARRDSSDPFISAASPYLSSRPGYQIGAVDRLMAFQFLVEHQLSTMPNLDHFFLGGKMFRLPRRREVFAL